MNYTIDAHSLKNTADNIGAVELSQMAEEHEQAGKNGDFEYIEANYEALLSLYEIVLKEIVAVRRKERPENVEDIKLRDVKGRKERDVKLRGLLGTDVLPGEERQEYDTEVGDEKMQPQSSLTDVELRTLLDNVIDMLNDFEVDEAKKILRQMRKMTDK